MQGEWAVRWNEQGRKMVVQVLGLLGDPAADLVFDTLKRGIVPPHTPKNAPREREMDSL